VKPAALRYLWLAAGVVSLLLGLVGIVLPLLPTVPFVILAAFCFSKGSKRWEKWLLDHPKLGPYVRDWREHHAVPLRAKQLAIFMMACSCAGTWYFAPAKIAWIPTVACAGVATWLLRLPTRKKT
jgi:uncharacterized membrane protein YbaN (DUF454 family)